ncbi:MAG TPA: DUF6504 family protein [Mycobacteriales bacterium]|nr:DUF6504 family protein [Mycobacteriales bacterium]
MTRLHRAVIDVEMRATPEGPQPEQFCWRGRRYLVREVLAHWTSSGQWWRAPDLQPAERSWWRIEADTGVYDLCFDSASDSGLGAWSLVRVLD